MDLSVPAEESYWPNAGQLFEYSCWHLLVAVIQPQLYAPKQLGYCGVWCGFLAVPGDVKHVLALSAASVPRSLRWPVCIHIPIIEPHHWAVCFVVPLVCKLCLPTIYLCFVCLAAGMSWLLIIARQKLPTFHTLHPEAWHGD